MSVPSRSECNHCQTELPLVHIRCSECSNTSICLSCFSKGVEFRNHLKTHSYKIIDKGSFQVVDPNWTAFEEKLLLDGIEQFGIGNWEDVAVHIGERTSKEVEEHYYASYIESVDLGRVTVPNDIPNRMTDHTPPLHESILSIQLPRLDLDKEEELELAYMPLRDDYEMEHDNEAEILISGLAINGDEDELDLDLKVAQVGMYLDKLKERHRRKSVAREYHLVEKFIGKPLPGAKQDRDYLKRLRLCFQYMREEQALNFARDARKEQILKTKIKHLKMYRKNGIKRLEDGVVFDVKQRRRNKINSEIRQSSTSDSSQNEKPIDRLSSEYGHHLLSSDEKTLCRMLKMIPSRYLTTKTLIIKDFIQKKYGLGIKIRFPGYLEKFQRKKIQSFLNNNGWLPRVSAQ
uniref:transcriptional adapter 2-beta-like n=1 Tax=Styela clava TaxID=7725 RepID=UPI0019395213|nr:transcriptional adapter 2-beta-like [Styela clava]